MKHEPADSVVSVLVTKDFRLKEGAGSCQQSVSRFRLLSSPWATGKSDRVSLSAGNMGFEVEALRSIGGFDAARGPRGTQMAFGEETAVENLMLATFGPEAVWFDAEFVNFHAVRPEKYRWQNLAREQFQRGTARAQLAKAGLAGASSSIVPDCLKPRPAPPELAAATSPNLRQSAVKLALGAARYAGVIWPSVGQSPD